MDILVIGNGFDLAHGLPTKYTDFLEFVQVIKQALSKGKLTGIDWGNTNAEVKKLLISNKGNIQENLFSNRQIWEGLINDNIWIEYFLQCDMYEKENWIDFESEISKIIQSLDNDIKGESGKDFSFDETIREFSNEFLDKKFSDYTSQNAMIESCLDLTPGSSTLTYRGIRDTLLSDLNKLTRALEIYLTEYVEGIDLKKISSDIQSIRPKGTAKLSDKTVYDAYVLCFN